MSKIKLNAASGGSVSLKPPTQTTSSANVELTLPVNDGDNGQFLQTNGSGALSFATPNVGNTGNLLVLEQFYLLADGRSITTSNGTVTTTNVTAVQDATDAHATLTGSSISYQPPTGTTEVIYEFMTAVQETNSNNRLLSTFAVQIDGTTIEASKDNIFLASSEYLDHLRVKFPIRIKSTGSDDNESGDRAGWSSAKTISVIANRYSSSYAMQFHVLRYWGNSGTTGDDLLKKPYVGITAIGTPT